VAVTLGGTRERFVALMNAKVRTLGLTDTHFVNPSGMDADEHYTSAYDIAVIARYAMQNPTFRTIAATSFIISDDYYMRNFNPLIATYAGADGVKIGFTDIANRTIVASAARDGHRVFVAALGSRNTQGDTIALFEWVWRSFQW
jgi:D-alanyl-D-alanine carboxypeptidase